MQSRRSYLGDCPDFRVSENGTVPFAAVCVATAPRDTRIRTVTYFAVAALAPFGIACSAMAQPNVSPLLPPTITVRGTGEVEAKPDMATITVGVVTEAGEAAQAVKDNNEKTEALFHVLRQNGIAERDVQTTGFYVHPEYGATHRGGRRRGSPAIRSRIRLRSRSTICLRWARFWTNWPPRGPTRSKGLVSRPAIRQNTWTWRSGRRSGSPSIVLRSMPMPSAPTCNSRRRFGRRTLPDLDRSSSCAGATGRLSHRRAAGARPTDIHCHRDRHVFRW